MSLTSNDVLVNLAAVGLTSCRSASLREAFFIYKGFLIRWSDRDIQQSNVAYFFTCDGTLRTLRVRALVLVR